MTEIDQTEKLQAVMRANSWIELKGIIEQHGPFVSYSRGYPQEWGAEKLIANMEQLRALGVYEYMPINIITRACGLRAKVAELLLSGNYGDPWE